jgi:hypothetical protein
MKYLILLLNNFENLELKIKIDYAKILLFFNINLIIGLNEIIMLEKLII